MRKPTPSKLSTVGHCRGCGAIVQRGVDHGFTIVLHRYSCPLVYAPTKEWLVRTAVA
jgi:hypothetical protein